MYLGKNPSRRGVLICSLLALLLSLSADAKKAKEPCSVRFSDLKLAVLFGCAKHDPCTQAEALSFLKSLNG